MSKMLNMNGNLFTVVHDYNWGIVVKIKPLNNPMRLHNIRKARILIKSKDGKLRESKKKNTVKQTRYKRKRL